MSGYSDLARILTLRPLTSWPGPRTSDRVDSPFRAGWPDTVEILVHELDAIGARRTVLELPDLTDRDLRLDGLPYARWSTDDPGVVLSFETDYGPLRYAVDTYVRPSYRRGMESWQHNVRAIALALRALRSVDRYGVTKRGEQYVGWRALGSGDVTPASGMTYETAVEIIADASGYARWGADHWPKVIRAARFATHPDRNGGDQTRYDRVEQAVALIERTRR